MQSKNTSQCASSFFRIFASLIRLQINLATLSKFHKILMTAFHFGTLKKLI